jgi:hypothetical protein
VPTESEERGSEPLTYESEVGKLDWFEKKNRGVLIAASLFIAAELV